MHGTAILVEIMQNCEWHLLIWDRCKTRNLEKSCYCKLCQNYILLMLDDYTKANLREADKSPREAMLHLRYCVTVDNGSKSETLIQSATVSEIIIALRRELLHTDVDACHRESIHRMGEKLRNAVGIDKIENPYKINPYKIDCFHPAWPKRWDFADGKITEQHFLETANEALQREKLQKRVNGNSKKRKRIQTI
jgi:hypothetical protein